MMNDRKKRLSDALRANLLKRKQQQRERKTQIPLEQNEADENEHPVVKSHPPKEEIKDE